MWLGACGGLAVWRAGRYTASVGADEPGQEPFADFEYLPPPSQYSGRVFKLSQQYPATPPPKERIPAFFKIDFTKSWREYLLAARDYCFEGNITPGGDVEDDWQVAAANPPRWFHMPWQTFSPMGVGRGRDARAHSGSACSARQLAWTQVYSTGTTFAVGLFNEFGGYTIGQVWKDHNNPDPSKALFPEGTVICKLLFVDVPTDQVPCLSNPVEWTAYVPPAYVPARRRRLRGGAEAGSDPDGLDGERQPCAARLGFRQLPVQRTDQSQESLGKPGSGRGDVGAMTRISR